MVAWVSAVWVESHLDTPGVLVLDPRRPMKYLQGHLRGAVNLPMYKAFDPEARLLSPDALARWVGDAGLADDIVPIIYDSYDGQNGAMLAWLLEHLGRTDVHLMEVFFEQWAKEDREVFYRPVPAQPKRFISRVNGSVRADWKEVQEEGRRVVVDFRSEAEYSGEEATDGAAGHIPGAVNIVWRSLLGADGEFLAPKESLENLMAEKGCSPGDRIVGYCRTGPRAALGYLALKELGYDVSLYDGSFKDWAARDLPVESSLSHN